MAARDSDELATLAKIGLATPAQTEDLARDTLAVCQIVARLAVRDRRLRPDEAEDVAQEAAVKALGYLAKWTPERSAWRTFAAVVAKSAAAQMGRRYRREAVIVPLPEDLDEWEPRQ